MEPTELMELSNELRRLIVAAEAALRRFPPCFQSAFASKLEQNLEFFHNEREPHDSPLTAVLVATQEFWTELSQIDYDCEMENDDESSESLDDGRLGAADGDCGCSQAGVTPDPAPPLRNTGWR